MAVIAGALLSVFHADVNALIHLYVIGVFTAFTLSQAGMVRYWTRHRERGWRHRAVVNGAGALATGVPVERRDQRRDRDDHHPGSVRELRPDHDGRDDPGRERTCSVDDGAMAPAPVAMTRPVADHPRLESVKAVKTPIT